MSVSGPEWLQLGWGRIARSYRMRDVEERPVRLPESVLLTQDYRLRWRGEGPDLEISWSSGKRLELGSVWETRHG